MSQELAARKKSDDVNVSADVEADDKYSDKYSGDCVAPPRGPYVEREASGGGEGVGGGMWRWG